MVALRVIKIITELRDSTYRKEPFLSKTDTTKLFTEYLYQLSSAFTHTE